MSEPPLYRPFALLAFGAAVGLGAPLGVAMLAALHLGAPPLRVDWSLLHAGVQIFGFFGTLIVGVAHHLAPRFAGRPVERSSLTVWLAALLGAGLVLRLAGTVAGPPLALAAGAALQAAAFAMFGLWLRRALDPPPLALVRAHLSVATGWLAAACAVEALARLAAPGQGEAGPDLRVLRVVHAMGLYGGVLGWVLGVLLRAGPMFVAGWSVPRSLARAVPLVLAAGVGLVAAAELGDWPAPARLLLARLGELLPLVTVVAVAAGAGALRRARGGLPMLSRSPHEARIFRLALASAGTALLLAAASTVPPLAPLGAAVRHLVTIGVLTSIVVAMAFRLIPVLESVPLPWPRLRSVAFWSLLGGVVLRSGEVLAVHGLDVVRPLVGLSGLLVWLALACVAANLAGAIARRRVS